MTVQMYISRRETVIRGGLWVSLLSAHQKKSNDGSFVEFESLAREIKDCFTTISDPLEGWMTSALT